MQFEMIAREADEKWKKECRMLVDEIKKRNEDKENEEKYLLLGINN